MTLLSDSQIRASVESGELAIQPYKPERVQVVSYDLTLSKYFLVFERNDVEIIDPLKNQEELNKLVTIGDDDDELEAEARPFVIHPGEFVLASTQEAFRFGRNTAGRLEGKSSIGRLRLVIHATAGFFDPGFDGYPTLEI